MKKVLFLSLVTLGLFLSNSACNRPYLTFPPLPPIPAPIPVCGISAPMNLPGFGPAWAGYSQTNPPTNASFCVVRNSTDWQAFWGSATPPAPPVDFSVQMLVIVVNYGICPLRNASITNVCVGPNQVTVSVKDPAHVSYNQLCAGPFSGYSAVAVAVNNSNLPVTWTVDTTP